MSDVIWAAIVAAGSTSVVAYFSGRVTVSVARHQSAQASSAAESHARVELVKVQAENDRLHRAHLEADRQVRRDAYARLLTTIEQFDALSSGTPHHRLGRRSG